LEEDEQRIPFKNWCALITRTAAEVRDKDADKFFGDAGWLAMKNAHKIRNRISHPKQPTDMEITDDDINCMREAMTWLMNCLYTILELPK
jgi:hypothetical protein